MATSMPSGPRVSLSMPTLKLSMPARRPAGVPRSSAEKLWLVGGAIVGFFLIVIGYFLLIAPQRSSTSDVKGQIADASTSNQALELRIDTLRSQFAQLPKYEAQLAQARKALPTGADMTTFLRSLQSMGAATSTTVSAQTAAQPVQLQDTSAAAATSTSTPAPATTAAPTGTGIYAIPITVQVSGSATNLEAFLTQLQRVQPRAVVITQITESAATADAKGMPKAGGMSLSLSMAAFMQPAGS